MNRLKDVYARDGLEFARSTMCSWHLELADLCEPLIAAMRADAFELALLRLVRDRVVEPPGSEADLRRRPLRAKETQEEAQGVRADRPLRTVRLFRRTAQTDLEYFVAVATRILERIKSGEKIDDVWAEYERGGAPSGSRLLVAELAVNAFGEARVPSSMKAHLLKRSDTAGLNYAKTDDNGGLKISGFTDLSDAELERLEVGLRATGVKAELKKF